MLIAACLRVLTQAPYSLRSCRPCIVFIDEIDAIGGSRKSYDSSGGGGRKTLNQLLVEMDGFESNDGVIVIAATNSPETLDAALTRPGRFDRHVHIPVPDVKGRRAILTHYLADKPLTADVDVDVLARGTSGMSGAELSNLVNTAAIQAAVTGEERVSARLLDWARDRVLMGQVCGSVLDCAALVLTHSAGAQVVLRQRAQSARHRLPRGGPRAGGAAHAGRHGGAQGDHPAARQHAGHGADAAGGGH